MKSFIDKCMTLLLEFSQKVQESHEDLGKCLGIVNTLSEFLDRYEGKKPVKPELKSVNAQY